MPIHIEHIKTSNAIYRTGAYSHGVFANVEKIEEIETTTSVTLLQIVNDVL